jgi:hypothetical protein
MASLIPDARLDGPPGPLVAMGHGRVLETGGREGLADVMSWMRRGQRALPAPS